MLYFWATLGPSSRDAIACSAAVAVIGCLMLAVVTFGGVLLHGGVLLQSSQACAREPQYALGMALFVTVVAPAVMGCLLCCGRRSRTRDYSGADMTSSSSATAQWPQAISDVSSLGVMLLSNNPNRGHNSEA